jgi:SAM-dependent methyltransferase
MAAGDPQARAYSGTRSLSVAEANALPAGADHYRAFVGPPDRYDFISSSQFSLLFTLGLRDHHRVLDFGCGSLRLGRLLIPFLRPGGYFGIEPNRWLIEEAIERELGRDAIRIKQPSFSFNDDFRCSVFGIKFDYIVAQSILTHCGLDLARRLLGELSGALAPSGIAAFSALEAEARDATPGASGWIYPSCVAYGKSTLVRLCAEAGLACRRIPWHHPEASWYVAALPKARLPTEDDMQFLRGVVLATASAAD